MDDLGREFLDRSARYLAADYLPRVRGAVEAMGPDDLWWRPNEASNSVGNLLLHLAGNLRQWVVHGVGGAEDVRTREREFAADGTATGADGEATAGSAATAAELLDSLAAVVREAAWTLERADAGVLGERRTIQGNDVTVFEAVYHAVEHFGMHTGQVIWIAKARSGKDLGFYRVEGGVAEARWLVE